MRTGRSKGGVRARLAHVDPSAHVTVRVLANDHPRDRRDQAHLAADNVLRNDSLAADNVLRKDNPFAPRLALALTGRVVAFVPANEINVLVATSDFDQILVRARITEQDLMGSFNVQAGLAYYSRLFDFRVGVGYGRFIIPEFGFVLVQDPGVVFSLWAYFRF